MYPQLPDLIKYLKKLPATKSIFLVTNGQEPKMLERLKEEDALPTQLYLSTNAPNAEIFTLVNRPKYRDAWERWNASLELLAELDTRTVLRFTLIKNYNVNKKLIPEYAKLINHANVHFIELKSYMHVGRSRNRLEYSNSPDMLEIRHFSDQLVKQSGIYSIMDESEMSRIVVLQNQKRLIDRVISSYSDTN
jgi:tRNA wybutosine-synthesizing protein 1